MYSKSLTSFSVFAGCIFILVLMVHVPGQASDLSTFAKNYFQAQWQNKDLIVIEKTYHPKKPIWIYNVRTRKFLRYPYRHNIQDHRKSPSGNKLLMYDLDYSSNHAYTLIDFNQYLWNEIDYVNTSKFRIKGWFDIDPDSAEGEKDTIHNYSRLMFWIDDYEIYASQRVYFTTKSGEKKDYKDCRIYNIQTEQWRQATHCEYAYASHGYNWYFQDYSPYSNALLYYEYVGTGVCEYRLVRWKPNQSSRTLKLHKNLQCSADVRDISLNRYSNHITVLTHDRLDDKNAKPGKNGLNLYEIDIDTMKEKLLAKGLPKSSQVNPHKYSEILWQKKNAICVAHINRMDEHHCSLLPKIMK
jgi:hypothetical protein